MVLLLLLLLMLLLFADILARKGKQRGGCRGRTYFGKREGGEIREILGQREGQEGEIWEALGGRGRDETERGLGMLVWGV